MTSTLPLQALRQRAEHVALVERHVADAELLRVQARFLHGRAHDVDAVHLGLLDGAGRRRSRPGRCPSRDRRAPGCFRLRSRLIALLREPLARQPRDERAVADGHLEVEELDPAEDVGERLAGQSAASGSSRTSLTSDGETSSSRFGLAAEDVREDVPRLVLFVALPAEPLVDGDERALGFLRGACRCSWTGVCITIAAAEGMTSERLSCRRDRPTRSDRRRTSPRRALRVPAVLGPRATVPRRREPAR